MRCQGPGRTEAVPSIKRLSTPAVVFVGLVALFACARSSVAQGPGEGEIFGTFTFNGCTPPRTAVTVRAIRFDVAGPPESSPGGGPRAAISATSDPRIFDFRVGGLEIGQVYALRAGVPPGLCGKLIVQAENSGMAVAGFGIPVRLTGYAIQSRFDVLGTAKLGRHVDTWVPAEAVDVSDENGAFRQIRFSTDLPGVIGFEFQVSTRPFPKSERPITNSCREPSIGLFYRQAFSLQGLEGEQQGPPQREFETTIDFYNLVNGGFETLSPSDRLQLHRGAPLHVRAVPYTPDGPSCDTAEVGINPEILIASITIPTFLDQTFSFDSPLEVDPLLYWPPVFDFDNFTHGTWLCLTVIRKHPLGAFNPYVNVPYDPYDNAYFLTYNKTTAEIGDKFCFNAAPSNDSDVVNQAVSIVNKEFSTALDGLAWVVNNASELWDEAEALAVEAAADAISDTGLGDCSDSDLCKEALKAALTYAMASMGVPPSLPNYDQLMNEGVDYIAARAASEAGIPPELAEEVADHAYALAKNEIARSKEKRSFKGFEDWLVPDIGWQFARGKIFLVRTGLGAATPEKFTLEPSKLFLGTQFDIPTKWPGHEPGTYVTHLPVPLTLAPDVSSIGAQFLAATDSDPFALPLWYKDEWATRFMHGLNDCKHWQAVVDGRLPSGDVLNFLVIDARLPTDHQVITLDPFLQSCNTYGD